MPEQPTARARIERAFHVSFKLPEQAAELLDAYRDQVLTEGAELLKAQHDGLFAVGGGGVAAGVLISADLLLAARTAPDAP